MKKIRKLNVQPEQLLDEYEMERFVAGCFAAPESEDLLLHMFSDVCRCTKTMDYHHEYAVFKIASGCDPVVRDENDNFYGHPYGSGSLENKGAKYREVDALMRYYKISIPGVNGGAEHVLESTTTRYY